MNATMTANLVHPEVMDAEFGASWSLLKGAATALQALQAKDGSLERVEDAAQARELVRSIIDAITDLTPSFPHDEAYLKAVVVDFERWADQGFGVPDFLDSLMEFHPERHRVNGLRHLVVFPMYTQNGSLDRHVEALALHQFYPFERAGAVGYFQALKADGEFRKMAEYRNVHVLEIHRRGQAFVGGGLDLGDDLVFEEIRQRDERTEEQDDKNGYAEDYFFHNQAQNFPKVGNFRKVRV